MIKVNLPIVFHDHSKFIKNLIKRPGNERRYARALPIPLAKAPKPLKNSCPSFFSAANIFLGLKFFKASHIFESPSLILAHDQFFLKDLINLAPSQIKATAISAPNIPLPMIPLFQRITFTAARAMTPATWANFFNDTFLKADPILLRADITPDRFQMINVTTARPKIALPM